MTLCVCKLMEAVEGGGGDWAERVAFSVLDRIIIQAFTGNCQPLKYALFRIRIGCN